MPEKAAFFHFYSAFCFIPREISGLADSSKRQFKTMQSTDPHHESWTLKFIKFQVNVNQINPRQSESPQQA